MSMQPHSYISDFDQLRKWFEVQKCVKWNLYRGFHERMPERSIVHKQREEQVTPEESWVMLQDMIVAHSNGGGKFTIFLPAYGAAKGPSAFFGTQLQGVSLPPGLAGIHGRNGSPAVGYVSPQDVQRQIDEAVEKERLHRKIEDLESSIGAKQTWQDVLFEKILQLDPDKAIGSLGNFLSQAMKPAPTSQVQVRGINREEVPPSNEPTEAADREYDGNRLVAVLDQLFPHFEDENDLLTFLEKVAERFCENPELYRGLIEGNG